MHSIVIVTFLVLLFIVGVSGVNQLVIKQKSMSKFAKEYMHEKQRINALPLQSAKDKAEMLLADSQKFRCIKEANGNDVLLERLSPQLRAFFSLYQTVETVLGEARLNRADIKAVEYDKGLLQIGTDMAGTTLVVRPLQETVYIIDGTERSKTEISEHQFPSLYHWILMTNFILYE